MRLVGQLSSACEHAREHVSLQLDRELSEFEQLALDAHLKACAGCRAFASSAGAVSAELRTAALQYPEFPVVLPHRTRLRVPARAVVQVAAAAAVALVVGLSSAGLSLTNGSHQSVSLRAAKAFPDRGPNLEPVRTSHTTIEFRSQRRTTTRAMSGRVAV